MSEADIGTIIILDLPAKLVYLPIIGTCLKTILDDVVGLHERDEVTFSVELAVYEACTNIVEHAYSTTSGRIEATVTLVSPLNRLIVDLVDYGSSFDMVAVPKPALDEPQVHGYGLFLIRELMDEVNYRPLQGRNHLRLVKNLVASA